MIADDLEREFATRDHARRFVRSLAGRDLLFEIVLDDHSEARQVARGVLTHAQTRSTLVVAIFLVGMVTLFMLLASFL